jgi:hypothetical protein
VAIMSLIQSAKIKDLDPYAYLKDLLERLPAQRMSAIDNPFHSRLNVVI